MAKITWCDHMTQQCHYFAIKTWIQEGELAVVMTFLGLEVRGCVKVRAQGSGQGLGLKTLSEAQLK